MVTKKRQALSLQEILETLRLELSTVRDRYRVRSLGVFGSYVRGEQRKRSDVDILVEFEEAPTLFRFMGLRDELSALLGVKVDLVIKGALKPYIGKRILDEVLYLSEAEGAPAAPPLLEGGQSLARRRREIRDYLKDILDNLADVENFTQGLDFDAFASDRQKVYAVLHALLIIGEAARKIPRSIRKRHPEIPWEGVVGLRNVVAHEYFAVYLPSIWQIVRADLPRLREVAGRILADLERAPDSP